MGTSLETLKKVVKKDKCKYKGVLSGHDEK